MAERDDTHDAQAGDQAAGDQPAGDQPAGNQPAGDQAAQPAAGEDDVRARFREALERKNAARHGTAAGPDDAPHGPHSATGPAKAQRQFRRKSG